MPKRHPIGRPIKAPIPQSDTVYFYLPNEMPYGIFCQWYPSCITVPLSSLRFLRSPVLEAYTCPLRFTCAEQFYMFCKALFFQDARSCERIMAVQDPKEQKKRGSQVSGFNEGEWTQVKSRVCEVGNWYKFTHPDNFHMREVLLGSGDRELAEAGRRDRVWGIGFRAHEAELYREEWGENRLGRALMEVRRRLRETMAEERIGKMVGWDWDGGEDEVVFLGQMAEGGEAKQEESDPGV